MKKIVLITFLFTSLFSYEVVKEKRDYTIVKCDNGEKKNVHKSVSNNSWCVDNFTRKCGYSFEKASKLTCKE